MLVNLLTLSRKFNLQEGMGVCQILVGRYQKYLGGMLPQLLQSVGGWVTHYLNLSL